MWVVKLDFLLWRDDDISTDSLAVFPVMNNLLLFTFTYHCYLHLLLFMQFHVNSCYFTFSK